jgi:hypothetical protein
MIAPGRVRFPVVDSRSLLLMASINDNRVDTLKQLIMSFYNNINVNQ